MMIAAVASADQSVQHVSGTCETGELSFEVTIDFTATGGDFSSGTGTADVSFTVINTSGVIPFLDPAVGNSVLTGFFFNISPGGSAAYTEARILAGATVVSTGGTINGIPVPPGCQQLGADWVQSLWYKLEGDSATGEFGIFTNALTTVEGIKAGLVDPDVYVNCVAQGDVFSPIVVAGAIKFTVALSGLDETLDSAFDFDSFCTSRPEVGDAASLAGKFQGIGPGGEDSCFIGDLCVVPTSADSWTGLKTRF